MFSAAPAAAFATVLATVLATGLATALPAHATPAPTPPDVAVGTAPQRPANVAAVSAAPAGELLHFSVALAPRNPAALTAFAAAVSNPNSPQYRHYLSPGEFGNQFGATQVAIAAVSAALTTRGLHVGTASSNGLSIPVTGTVSQVSTALRTSFKSYRLRSGRQGLANVETPKLPSPIARNVQGFVGLNQLTQALSRPAIQASAGSTTSDNVDLRAAAAPAATGLTACTAATTAAASTSAYTAPEVAQHYGLDALYPTTKGQGVTVALFELEPFNAADVAAYQACYQTHTAVSVRQVNGGAGTGFGTGEAALDIEEVIGLAPQTNIVVYEAPNDGASVYAELGQIATDDAAQVVSDSWGLCEAEAGVPELAELERPIFEQMAVQGQTVLAATGDSGSEGCYSPPDSSDQSLSVWEPASQPEVTAVGGTSVASITAADKSWNDVFGATGGGISALWPMPAYQLPLGSIPNSTNAPCGAPATQLCRETPDVSAMADLDHGSLAYYAGSWIAVGGTSAATPIWASLVALIDGNCAAGSVGFINPALYALTAAHSTALTDVSTGPTNDYTGANPGQYPTTAGYDLTTGLGTPHAAALASGLCPAVGAAGTGTMSVSPTLVQPSTMTSLTFTYTPATGQGMVDGELDVTVPGTWTLPTTTPNVSGYTTASAGIVSVIGNTISVTGITAPAGQKVTITYGDTRAGASPAQAPSVAQISVFAARSRQAKNGATAALAINPAVRVMPAGQTGISAVLTRIAGSDRIQTSIAESRAGFPSDGSAGAVVLARADLYPDAIAGVPLAAANHAPMLLTPSSGLTSALAAEISRVLPIGHTVFVLGGPASLSPSIDLQLQSMGYVPVRVAGASRYETAVKIANALGNPTTVFEVDGSNFPDALTAGPAAAITHGAVLFTYRSTTVDATTSYLSAHPASVRYAVGGPAAAADPGASKIVGADRFETSVLVAQSFFYSPSLVGVASGVTFPDALSGGPITALAGGPIILVPPAGNLPAPTQRYLAGVANSVLSAWLFGGPAAVNTAVANEVAQSLVLVPPST